ncbi:MAG: acyl-CoA mutase large subunit family protein [candidate division Zixibacteria bacterium]|nr:acyl-CoA mutase large subunit family protein [candidate division Zixibacteria bacterium]
MPKEEPQGNGAALTDERLLNEFEVPRYDTWCTEVERLLKGAPFEKRMLTETYEGITLQPLYCKKDTENIVEVASLPGFAPYLRGSKAYRNGEKTWEIAQELSYPTAEEFNRAVCNDLKCGLTAVTLPLDEASRQGYDPDTAVNGVGRGGVSLATYEDFKKALEGVNLDRVPVFIRAGTCGVSLLALYIALAMERGVNPAALNGAVALDPLGELAVSGKLPLSLAGLYDEMTAMTFWASENAPGVGTVWIHGEPYNDAGANAVQELAFVLAAAVEYLRELEKRGLEIETSLPHFRFSMGLGTNFFMETAKFRAARLLWNRVLQACKVSDDRRVLLLHGRSSRYYQTKLDPYVNLLRLTTEAFSGAIGGADSLEVAPFDEMLRPTNEFSRRLARNIQIILKDEAKLAKILDPAGGSWYVEKLTHEIAEKTWRLFKEIENKGGMCKALIDGMPQDEIKKTAAKRAAAFAVRKDILVGANKYPSPTEQPLEVKEIDYTSLKADRAQTVRKLKSAPGHKRAEVILETIVESGALKYKELMPELIAAVQFGATCGEVKKTLHNCSKDVLTVTPIPSQRAAEPFENLRSAVEKHRVEKGSLKVFLATLGPVGAYMPRLDFAASFFEVGGFEVVRTGGYETADDAADSALASGAEIVVICGLDSAYVEGAPVIARKVKKDKPKTIIVLAGLPTDDKLKKLFTDAGVDRFIHIKADLLEVLSEVAAQSGVSL